jgi:SAM-dependent methyltransferase
VNPIERIHEKYIKAYRARALASAIASAIPLNATVLDVGCGDGSLAAEIGRLRPDLTFQGLEVAIRGRTAIPVSLFDGIRLPFPPKHFDVVVFADVLHHTEHAESLVMDAKRVGRAAIVIKDHRADGFLARPILRFMDRVGNVRFGVSLPYLYLTWSEWERLFDRVGVRIESVQTQLRLYPRPFSWLFERSLHFVARLAPAQ